MKKINFKNFGPILKILTYKKLLSFFYLLLFILLLSSCATHYKIMPKYEECKDRIETIAIYPLYFSEEGEEQELFGVYFNENFCDSIKSIQTKTSLKFISSEETVSYFEKSGRKVVLKKKEIDYDGDKKSITFYWHLTTSDIKSISKNTDGILFCDLLYYNEVSPAGQMAQSVGTKLATGCLTGGMYSAGASERNKLKMEITLFETTTGEALWKYTANFNRGLIIDARKKFTDEIIKELNEYFPYSKEFEGDKE